MGILDMWREERGTVLRKEYEDTMARMRDANPAAKAAFLNNIHQTIDHIIGFYSSSPVAGRKAFLEKMRKAALDMWRRGDWPSALGLAISCLNAECRFVAGGDAAYVKLQTDRIIKEASEAACKAECSGKVEALDESCDAKQIAVPTPGAPSMR